MISAWTRSNFPDFRFKMEDTHGRNFADLNVIQSIVALLFTIFDLCNTHICLFDPIYSSSNLYGIKNHDKIYPTCYYFPSYSPVSLILLSKLENAQLRQI